MEHYKAIKQSNHINVRDKKWIEVNDLSGGQYSSIKI